MRLKTLGVFLITLMALFTMFYWVTDGSRRTAAKTSEDKELLAYGSVVFANDASNPSSAGCARCHGPDGKGGKVPNDPNGAIAPNLHSASIAAKLKVNADYVHLVVSYGGVVVSGNVNSPMPAWSTEVGGPLTVQQIDAVVALVTSWAEAAPPAPRRGAEHGRCRQAGLLGRWLCRLPRRESGGWRRSEPAEHRYAAGDRGPAGPAVGPRPDEG